MARATLRELLAYTARLWLWAMWRVQMGPRPHYFADPCPLCGHRFDEHIAFTEDPEDWHDWRPMWCLSVEPIGEHFPRQAGYAGPAPGTCGCDHEIREVRPPLDEPLPELLNVPVVPDDYLRDLLRRTIRPLGLKWVL